MGTLKNAIVLGVCVVLIFTSYSLARASEITGDLPNQEVMLNTPVASPAAGTYTAAQSVTLSVTDAVSIHYTVDGTDPDCTNTGITYVLAIQVGESLTIKAISCYSNNNASSVVSFGYVINLPTPTPPPSGGGGGGSGGWIAPSPLSSGASQVDANGDGVINILDFNSLMIQWGSTGANLSADFDKNGVVDMIDFNMLMVYWS